ncbi:hypothetical protein HHL23_05640 [Chryseobacterium sp. RP-3-3]|uniref:Uncharacterized protein n=1 Tax=Chryseobacterium antibioticum TaxID=2728847 RepID=A0A7Y0ALB3_9FLAO|nr:hypothetical protein [Chryseobacterium antibioticum]NML69275.1 hypothetical protein [Chryseobacterium antibioticum]
MDYSKDRSKDMEPEIYEDIPIQGTENGVTDQEPEDCIPFVEIKNNTVGIDISAMPFVLSHEDEIINYIKDKATKETLKSLAPLLEKLEEAVKQQEAYQSPAAASPVTMNYDEQLKQLQEASVVKIKDKELKIAERMNKLQIRFANIRK